jgi:hypothetical protein
VAAIAPKIFYDLLGAFDAGMNSGVEPILLAKNQLAFAFNATMRGGFIQPRPPVQKCPINYNGDTVLQTAIETGFFQGAGFYRPDFGPSSVLAQISGRLFRFVIVGGTCTASEVTIPGDPNDATTNQVWMWQAEKWLIITDGTAKLPIFYDGVSARRSYGPSTVLASVTAIVDPATGIPPAIGEIMTVTTAAAYAGPFNVPVLFNNAYYQPVQSSSPTPSYSIILTNAHATVGATVPSGSSLMIRSDYMERDDISRPFFPTTASAENPTGWAFEFVSRRPGDYSIGLDLLIDGRICRVYSIGPPAPNGHAAIVTYVVSPLPSTLYFVPAPVLIQRANVTSPNVLLGNITASFINPATNGMVNVTIDLEYSGPNNQTAWIGLDQYSVSYATPPAPSTTLYLINLTDVSVVAVTPLPQDILSVPELPAGRMGAYGLGQNWMCLTDGLSFIVSDPVGGASGTPANQYRDAVLKYTELTFRGGNFRIPTSGTIISSMNFTATLDVSLGQGALIIGTDQGMYSCLAPVDFSSLPNINGPILTAALIGFGPLAQNSTVLANSDTIFRSIEGLGSLVIARRDFGEWGNTPISREMARVFQNDNRSLLSYGSSVVFDNRLLASAAPAVSGQGVFHQGVVALNFDLLSNLRGKAPPAYDGLWTGLNILQNVSGLFDGTSRGFAITFNLDTNRLELYELLPSSSPQKFDNGSTRIKWGFETPLVFGPQAKPPTELARLMDGEFMVQDMVGTVHVKVQYRPDFYPCWVDWREFDVCADTVPTNAQPGYLTRLGLGEPSSIPCESGNNRPLRTGHFFQLRFEFTGHCRFMGARIAASPEPVLQFAPPVCAPVCEDLPLPDEAGPAPQFGNAAVTYCVECEEGNTLTYSGTLPGWITLDTGLNCLVGAANSHHASTQELATALAQIALNEFVVVAVIAGDLVCAPDCTETPIGDMTWNTTTNFEYSGETEGYLVTFDTAMAGANGHYNVTSEYTEDGVGILNYAVFRTNEDVCYDCDADYRVRVTATLTAEVPGATGEGISVTSQPSADPPVYGAGTSAFFSGDTIGSTAVVVIGPYLAGEVIGLQISSPAFFQFIDDTFAAIGQCDILVEIIPA